MTLYKSIGLSEKLHCYNIEDRSVFLNFGKVEILKIFHRTAANCTLVNDVIFKKKTNLLFSACDYAFTINVYKYYPLLQGEKK